MNKKLIGLFIITLLITISLSVVGSNVAHITTFNNLQNYDFIPGEFIVKFDEGIDF